MTNRILSAHGADGRQLGGKRASCVPMATLSGQLTDLQADICRVDGDLT
jgi:hypothetical protein